MRSGSSAWEIEEVEPWTAPVDGNALLNELKEVIQRYVVLPKWGAETVALWVVHTHAFQLRDVSTYLGIESPEKRCGKTTLLSVLSELSNRAVALANISSPAVFRAIEEKQPTLLIDEVDTFLQGNDQLRGILNSGYTRKTAFVVRVGREMKSTSPRPSPHGNREADSSSPSIPLPAGADKQGNSALTHRPLPQERGTRRGKQSGEGERRAEYGSRLERFSCWCPKVMAAIGHLPETLADRCIVIRMQRKTPGEECEKLRNLDGSVLRRKCARFVKDHAREIACARPALPPDLNDRAGDVWEPLLAIAELAGVGWPEEAREAATGLTCVAQASSPIGALLSDISECFEASEMDRLFSRTLVEWLRQCKNRPWIEVANGKLITELWLSHQLRPYGIRPKTMWIGEQAAKGYLLEDFGEVFRRYLPRSS